MLHVIRISSNPTGTIIKDPTQKSTTAWPGNVEKLTQPQEGLMCNLYESRK